jgi:glucosyl-dolichyl phosphate glucuronosyltransferase
VQAERHEFAVSPLLLDPFAVGRRLRLDVLIPTHNRAPLLERCVLSVLQAVPGVGLSVHVTVVCNACSDGSREIVRRLQALHPGRVSLVEERRRGKSKALNAGIAATTGDLVGMIDDDEEVSAHWLQAIADAFQDPALDFIGGPYLAVWDAPPPAWVPDDYLAVLGAMDNGWQPQPYTPDFPGMLKGGNAVIRRSTLNAVGPYAEHLGPGAFARLFSCEDEDMYCRLLKHGANGKYLPDLVIYHYVTGARLTREYYREWCFWRCVSRGLMDRRHPLPVAYLAGVPRFLWGRAARGLMRTVLGSRTRPQQERFTDELRMWDVAGYFYGRHIYTLARFSPVKSRRRSSSPDLSSSLRQHVDELGSIERAG